MSTIVLIGSGYDRVPATVRPAVAGTTAAEQLTTSSVQIAGRQVFSSACLQERRIFHPYSTLIFGVHYCYINFFQNVNLNPNPNPNPNSNPNVKPK